jgi:hypothetical protein
MQGLPINLEHMMTLFFKNMSIVSNHKAELEDRICNYLQKMYKALNLKPNLKFEGDAEIYVNVIF